MANTVVGILLIAGALGVFFLEYWEKKKAHARGEEFYYDLKRLIFIIGTFGMGIMFLLGIMDVADAGKH